MWSPPVRLPVLALAAAGGVIAAGWVAAAWWAWAALAAVIAAQRALPRGGRWCAVVACALAALAARAAVAPSPPPGVVVADDRAADTVEGWVSGPLVPGPGGTGFVLDADGASIWVTARELRDVWPGDRVIAVGRLETPRGRRNPGSPDREQIVRGPAARAGSCARGRSRWCAPPIARACGGGRRRWRGDRRARSRRGAAIPTATRWCGPRWSAIAAR